MQRLRDFSLAAWQSLTDSERERYYYDIGVIGFVENIAELLGFDLDNLTPDEIDSIAQQLL